MTRNGFSPPSIRGHADYEEIEAAVMETARGRWFLAEFARRNRSADTNMLLDAIHKLQIALQDRQQPDGLGNLRNDLMEMSTSIAQTRRDLAAMPVALDETSGDNSELDSIVATTEKATSDILGAAEQVQEIAWTLREQGASAEACDTLNTHATNIYTACSFQDITGQRISKVIAILNDIETRLNALVDVWGLDDIEIKPHDAPQNSTSSSAGSSADESMPSHFPAPLPSRQEVEMMPAAPGSDTQAATAPEEVPLEAAAIEAPAEEPPLEVAAVKAPAEVEAPAEQDEKDLALFDQLAADLDAATRLAASSSPPAPRGAETSRPDDGNDFDQLSQPHKTALFS